MAAFLNRTTLKNENYDADLAQSMRPLKHVFQSDPSLRPQFTKRQFHETGDFALRPAPTNLKENSRGSIHTVFQGHAPLQTRHIFADETPVENELRPVNTTLNELRPTGGLEIPRFHPNGYKVHAVEPFVRGGASSREEARRI
jgi:hypothetical protein